jgi:hypothetical protein
LGEDFIECHHTLALSELQEKRPARIDEIALVCSNCHRMIHRRRPWLANHCRLGIAPHRQPRTTYWQTPAPIDVASQTRHPRLALFRER